MSNNLKKQRGITLIALVVTIIILLILAGVSMAIVFNEGGIFKMASESAEKDKIAQILEELELLKLYVMPGTLDNYLEELEKEKDKYKASEFERLDDEQATVVIEDRYEFLIYTVNSNTHQIGSINNIKSSKVSSRNGGYKSDSGNIIIEFQGEINTGLLVLSEKKGTLNYPEPITVTVTKNVSGGELKVSSGDDSIASARIQGDEITITPKQVLRDGTKVTITVTSEANGKYRKQKAKYIATVNTGTIKLEATAYDGAYDGQKHPALTNVTVDPTDANLTYSLNGGEYKEEIPEVEGGGEYTVTIRAERAGYNKKEITKTITVRKQGNMNGTENANLELSETSGTITYPTPKIIEVIKNESGGELSVSSSDESIAQVELEGTRITITPQIIETDGQKVTITVKAQATGNYEEQTATYEATVNRGTITIYGSGYSGTYNGSYHNAVSVVSTDPSECTIQYKLGNGSYSTSIPTIISQGTYSITIMASKPGYVTATKNITATIYAAPTPTPVPITNPGSSIRIWGSRNC